MMPAHAASLRSSSRPDGARTRGEATPLRQPEEWHDRVQLLATLKTSDWRRTGAATDCESAPALRVIN
jgi:hypothetical protein